VSSHVPEQVGGEAEQGVAAAEPEAVPDGVLAAPGLGAAGPMGVGGLRRLPPRQRAQAIARLNAGGGNAAVSTLIQRWVDGPPQRNTNAELKIDLAKATDAEKIAECQRLLGQSGIGAVDGVEQIWMSFPDLRAAAKANPDLFLKSADKVPRMVKTEQFDPIRADFKTAVEEKVNANLEANRNYVMDEMKQLGIKDGGDQAPPSPEEDKKLAETQKLAEQASKAQKAKVLCQTLAIGTAFQGTGNAGGGFGPMPQRVKVSYSPNGVSTAPGFKAETGEGFHSWDEVDKQYKTAEAALQKILSSNPAVYALVSNSDEIGVQEGNATGDVAKAAPADARNKIKPAMTAVLNKIDDAAGKVGNDLDYRDFIPVHEQLMAGPKFGGPIEKAVIKVDVEGHETMKMLRSLGLGLLSAAAFILAEFATGGMATFLLVAAGIGVSATNAALSIDDYVNKKRAAEATSGNPALEIVSQAQADSAAMQAVIDSVFVFLDGAGAVAGGLSKAARASAALLEAAEAGVTKAAAKGLAEALAHGGEAAVQAIEKSVTEIGVEGTVKASGKSAQQLAEQVGKESDLGKRILAASDLAGKEGGKAVEELAAKVAKLGEITDKAEMETVAKQALDQFGVMGTVRRGGGWKQVTKALGKESGAGNIMMEWRESLVRDLEHYIAEQTQGATKTVQTGTQKSAVSDIDISTFGEDASQNVKKAREFIAGRAGCDSSELEKLLDLDVFADPSRMHLQDVTKGLTDEMRRDISRSAAKYEEQLIFARRIYDARKAGNDVLAEQITKEAEALGIKPFEGYKPLTKGEIDALQGRLDNLVKKLETASEAEKKQIIEEVGQTQGQILAEGGGGYATGGGVRLNVTERPMDIAKMPKVLTPRWPEVRYTAILAEGTHMDSAIQKLALEGTTPEAYAAAVKNIGKHGNRMVEVLGADVAHAPEGLAQLGEDLASWIEKAKDPEFVKSLGNVEELAKIRSQISEQLTQLKSASADGLKALREEAQLGTALTPAQMDQIQAWTKWQGEVTALANKIDALTPAVFETIHAGASTAPTGKEDEGKKASVPDPPGPNQSMEPPPASDPGGAPVQRAVAGGTIARQGDGWSGPSYARHGPEGSGVEERRGAMSPQQQLGEHEHELALESAQAVGWIGDGVSKVIQLEADFRRSQAEGKPFFGEDTLDFADRLAQIAEALEKLSIGVMATRDKVHDADASLGPYEDMDKAMKALKAVIAALAILKAGSKTNEALAQLQAKPSQAAADAWADGVVDSFDAFGKAVGLLDLPPGLGWITDYWQGLMGAPKAYVGFFRATMKARYGAIDAQVGIFESYHQFLREGEKTVWAGPACGMIMSAWMFDPRLQEWIFTVAPQPKPKLGGRVLWDLGAADVAAILMDTLSRSDKSEEEKSRWAGWLASQK
jgi:hypothetical protein